MRKKVIVFVLVLAMMISLSTTAVAVDQNEGASNDTMSTATRTQDDYNNYGTLSPVGDVDWWVVKFSASGCGSFWLGSIPSGHDFDLRVYNSSGTMIAKSINNGSVDEFITVDVQANTNYYIKVYGNGTASPQKYKMRAKLYTWKDTYAPLYQQENGDSCGAANIRMVLAKYGLYYSEAAIRSYADDYLGTGSYKDPNKVDDIINHFFQINSNPVRYSYHYVYNISNADYWSKVKKNIDSGYPMIAMVAYEEEDWYFPTPSDGHYITLRGYSPTAQTNQVRLNDSTRGTYCVRGIPLSRLNVSTRYPTGNCYFITGTW